jgi:DNA-binding response OmpR family regulator
MNPSSAYLTSKSIDLKKVKALKQILVVGVEEEHLLLLATLLKAEGHLVSVGRTDKEALSQLQERAIDFVIVDHFAPELDGLSLLEKIKALNRDIPVLILSSQYEMEHYMTAMNLGALDYFCKPVDYGDIQRIVNTHVVFGRNLEIKCV